MNNEPVAWTACLGCGQRVTSDSIHTCSPQLKTLTDEEITYLAKRFYPQMGDKLYSQPADITDEEILHEQQAEIETLKAGKIRAYDNGVEDGKKSNTNPAKTLTDEEINEVVWKQNLLISNDGLREFARAILRKVQEK